MWQARQQAHGSPLLIEEQNFLLANYQHEGYSCTGSCHTLVGEVLHPDSLIQQLLDPKGEMALVEPHMDCWLSNLLIW